MSPACVIGNRPPRGRVQPSRAGYAAGAFLVALAVLLAVPLQAQAQTATTLVSNSGQTQSSHAARLFAQPFTTGDNSAGYTLTSVEIRNQEAW